MKKVPASKVATRTEAADSPLPPKVQEALGEMVGAAREGLLALSVGVGLSVVHELMESEVTEVVGPKGKHDPDRTAKRHGHEDGSMTLGGRRVAGEPATDALSRRRARAVARHLRALRRSRSADQSGDGPDARRGLDPQASPASASRSAPRSSTSPLRPRGHRSRRHSWSAPRPRWRS